MSYVRTPDFLRTIGMMYTTRYVSCKGNPYKYEDIIWHDTRVLKPQLLADQIEAYKTLIDHEIRCDANKERIKRVHEVLGTEDAEQIRTYEEKYAEAKAYLADNTSPTPIMNAEISYTGETLNDLANLVVLQYEQAKSILRDLYGRIEGVRRNNVNYIKTVDDLLELQNYEGPVWP